MTWAVLLGGLLLGLGAVIALARALGRADTRSDAMEETLDQVAEANRARDAVRRDPVERQRLRDRFTRR